MGPSYGCTVLHTFSGSGGDGANPYAGMSSQPDSNKNYYGTTFSGGSSSDGTVFQLEAPSGTNTTYTYDSKPYSFKGSTSDGANPYAEVTLYQTVLASSPNLYGTTTLGGGTLDEGEVFELGTPATGGTFPSPTRLNTFNGSTGEGTDPRGGVVFDSAGNIYGTTSLGGAIGMASSTS